MSSALANYREITDANNRVYRIGESDREILGRSRSWMVWLPWLAMMAVSVYEYGYGAAEEAIRDAHGWSMSETFWLLAIWALFQAGIAFPAGKLREKGIVSARAAMLIGAALSALGFVTLTQGNLFVAYLGFAVCGGIGAGLVYATCINMVGKWFPERRGGKTGFVNGGFAYGAVPFIFIFSYALHPSTYVWVLDLVGAYMLVVLVICGLMFRDPPKNWWPESVDPLQWANSKAGAKGLAKNPPAVKQFTPMEAIKTGILPLMWFVLLCTAGINIFGIAMQVPFGKEMGFAGGIVALAMSLKAIINGTGRGVIGWISDRFGRRDTLILVCLVLGLAQYAVYFSGSIGNMPLFLLASMVSGFGGGAIFPLFAAMTADYFGENNNATNYGLVYSSKLVSGLVGAGMGSVVVSAWGYGAAFIIAGSVGVACAFLTLLLKQPKLPKSERLAAEDPARHSSQAKEASLAAD